MPNVRGSLTAVTRSPNVECNGSNSECFHLAYVTTLSECPGWQVSPYPQNQLETHADGRSNIFNLGLKCSTDDHLHYNQSDGEKKASVTCFHI